MVGNGECFEPPCACGQRNCPDCGESVQQEEWERWELQLLEEDGQRLAEVGV